MKNRFFKPICERMVIHMKKSVPGMLLCLLMTAVLIFNAAGCGIQVAAADLMEGVEGKTVTGRAADDAFISSSANFAVELFKKSVTQGENSLVSPLSVMLALAMTANGANAQTKTEMEAVLGGGITVEDLNEYLYTYLKNLPTDEKYKLGIANSIWIKDDGSLEVKPDFLQTNADYYDAAAYKAPFDDQTLVNINDWVKNNTDGMIEKILDKIDPDMVMYLINAVLFDAEWQSQYDTGDITDGTFNAYDGTKETAKMMSSTENLYLDDGKATGFVKNYAGGKYSFAALLPNEGVSIDDYIASLTGEGLVTTLKGVKEASVQAQLPKFTYEYKIKMNDALSELGMPTAFTSGADFSKMGNSTAGKLVIGEVVHKTYIEVTEIGTRAGAVTEVGMKLTSMPMFDHTVTLDRPFVYVIIDNATNLPIFIGTVLSVA